MGRAQPLTRFYVSSDYSVDYRRADNSEWTHETNGDYALLTCFRGFVQYSSSTIGGILSADQTLIFEPNTSIAIKSQMAEAMLLTLSASMLIPHAISMRLITPQSSPAFSPDAVTLEVRLLDVLRALASEIVGNDAGKEVVMNALVQQLSIGLLRGYAAVRYSPDLELSRAGILDRRIRRSVELMHAQPDQELSLKDLAHASYLSPFHFSRLFKKITGVTPHNYLAHVRVVHAKRLLADPGLSITAVGARVGYLSASHFSQAFRLATGTTPRAFRKGVVNRQD